MAQFIPSSYIPSYAVDVGLSSSKGSVLLSLMNLGEAIGQPLIGVVALVSTRSSNLDHADNSTVILKESPTPRFSSVPYARVSKHSCYGATAMSSGL